MEIFRQNDIIVIEDVPFKVLPYIVIAHNVKIVINKLKKQKFLLTKEINSVIMYA